MKMCWGMLLLAGTLLGTTSAVAADQCGPAAWRLMYRHDTAGKQIEGSRESLLTAIRRGDAIRVAWGFSLVTKDRQLRLEHQADPVFLTVVDEKDVFIQLPEHLAQASYHEPEKARFGQAGVMWRGLMGSDGTFDAIWVDRGTGQEVRRMAQRVGLSWFAFSPPPACDDRSPLTLAVPQGTIKVPDKGSSSQ